MAPKKKSQEEQQQSPPKQLLCADVISVVAEFLPPTDRHQKPLMLVSKLWLDGVAQQHGMQVLHDVHWPFAALRHRGSRRLVCDPWSPAVSTADLEQLVNNVPSHQVCSLKLEYKDLCLNCKVPDIDVSQLSAMENLTQLCLWLRWWRMPSGVGDLTSLRTLHITSSLNDIDCETISKLTCLEELSISSRFSTINPAELTHLVKLNRLRKLSLSRSEGFNDAHMKVISQMTQLTELRCEIVEQEFTDNDMVWLSHLVNLTRLTLDGFYNFVTGKGVRLLGKLKKLTYFSLSLENRMICNEDLVFFNELQELESFDLRVSSRFTLTDEGLGHIAGACNLRKLKLWLMTSNLTTAGLRHLERLPKLQSLHNLRFSKAEGTPTVESVPLKRLEIPGLEDLSLFQYEWRCDAGDFNNSYPVTILYIDESPTNTFKDVQHLSSLTNLEALTLIELRITGSGFANFHKLRKLKHLEISNCNNLQDQAMHHVCEISSLETLTVVGCHCLTDNAFSPIAKLRNVGRMSIRYCSAIDDNTGLMSIAGMKSLEILSITGCDITSEFLCSLRSNDSLRSLDIFFNETTSASFDSLPRTWRS